MTLAQFAVWTVWLAVAVIALFGSLRVMRALARIAFVGRVERVRDDIEDAVLRGDLDDVHAVHVFLAGADFLITDLSKYSFARVVFEVQEFKKAKLPPGRNPRDLYRELPAAQCNKLTLAERHLQEALRRYLFAGSPMGWLPLAFESLARRVLGVPKSDPLDVETLAAYESAMRAAQARLDRERSTTTGWSSGLMLGHR